MIAGVESQGLKSQMCFSNCNGLLSLQSYPQFSRHLLALSAANEDSVRGYNVGSEDPCRNRAGNSWLPHLSPCWAPPPCRIAKHRIPPISRRANRPRLAPDPRLGQKCPPLPSPKRKSSYKLSSAAVSVAWQQKVGDRIWRLCTSAAPDRAKWHWSQRLPRRRTGIRCCPARGLGRSVISLSAASLTQGHCRQTLTTLRSLRSPSFRAGSSSERSPRSSSRGF